MVHEWSWCFVLISLSPPNFRCPNSSPYPSNLSSSGLRTPVRPNIFCTATYWVPVPASEVNGSGNNVLEDRRRRGGPWERRSTLIARPFPLCATAPASLIAIRDTSGVSMPAWCRYPYTSTLSGMYSSVSPPRIDVQQVRRALDRMNGCTISCNRERMSWGRLGNGRKVL